MHGDIPSIIYGVQEDYKKLYYSDPDAARKVPITIGPGYGVLKMGTLLSVNTGAASPNKGQFFPFDPAAITGAENAPGRSYVVATVANGTAIAYVTLPDSYRFVVNDDIIICDNDLEANMDNGSVIISIDRTTYTHMAVITFTTAVGDDFTAAKFAYVTLEGNFVAVGVLEKSVDTGTGVNSQGAHATLILGNAVLYQGMLLNLDSGGRTDLKSVAFGQFENIP